MNQLKNRILLKQQALQVVINATPEKQIKNNTNVFNNFDNYGKNDDPETEWNNWVNWDQNPHPFSNSD